MDGGEPAQLIDSWDLIYRLAGIVGIDPDPFTLKQLDQMAIGKRSEDWDHTSLLATLIHNDPWGARKRVGINHYHPFRLKSVRQKPKRTIRDIDALAREFGAL